MNISEHKILNNNKNIIVCFGGMALLFGGILPFEFLNYLSTNYKNTCDLIFFIDKKQNWYHNGIDGITQNIDDTVIYLNNLIENYHKIIFMGTSAGGYASILFGSLCKNVNNVISFIPQTILKNNLKYSNLKNVINNKTKYLLYGDTSITNIDDLHHISHCENLENFTNIKIIKNNGCNLKYLRDSGFIKTILDDILLSID